MADVAPSSINETCHRQSAACRLGGEKGAQRSPADRDVTYSVDFGAWREAVLAREMALALFIHRGVCRGGLSSSLPERRAHRLHDNARCHGVA